MMKVVNKVEIKAPPARIFIYIRSGQRGNPGLFKHAVILIRSFQMDSAVEFPVGEDLENNV
jgi:hypothetical protein